MSIAVVWFKRDLRLTDHLPLYNAMQSGLPVLLVYNFEPMLLQDPNYSSRHWSFIAQSLIDIQARVPKGALTCGEEDMLCFFNKLNEDIGITAIYSHQEVGLNNTFERDLDVANWCRRKGINWQELPYAGVVRGKANRNGWDDNWDKQMRTPIVKFDLDKVNWYTATDFIKHTRDLITKYIVHGRFQLGGETKALEVLNSFFFTRGQSYAFKLSSPIASQHYCTRLSPYLAWGNVSLRQVYQKLLATWYKPGWRRSLTALSSRLHWHCHFIQKFESESEMEFRAVNRGYEGLPRLTGAEAKERLIAWQSGQTGIPMVDACMRSLHSTGYLNFRMRAMLVSFLCHHLELDWRSGVTHLASLFLDFEPGIHYSQFQMQAGVTGVNTIRIYNPVKQGLEKDPNGEFVKDWVPELADIPETLVHTPWLLTDMEQAMYGLTLGQDYPTPIVDVEQSYKRAQSLLWSWRNKPKVVQEKQRILARHVRPK